jgi:hypothetical protein
MRCRRVICAACCTRLAGVNHCRGCLETLALRSEEPRRGAGPRTAATLLLFAAAWLVLFGIAWLLQGRLAP